MKLVARVINSGTIPQLVAMAAATYPIIKTDSHSFVLTPSVVGPAHLSGGPRSGVLD